MRFRIHNIRLSLDQGSSMLIKKVCKKARISPSDIIKYEISKKSIDARKKDNILFVYAVDIEVKESAMKVLLKNKSGIKPVEETSEAPLVPGSIPLKDKPIVIGTGPAGLFAALLLAENGYKPIVLERGDDVDTRTAKVKEFWQDRKLDQESNVQFGEGGAGTFSDGKLTTRINNPRIIKVFEAFVESGAPEEILYLNKPHIGTDKLRIVVKNLRQRIMDLGGQVCFNSKVTDIFIEQGAITEIEINNQHRMSAQVVILAIGHSARDTYEMLEKQGVLLEPKAFAIGARIEHPQKIINESQYGPFADHPKLGAADYQLVYKNEELDRAAYTFCMCPGGQVVAAASEKDTVVTNGMSLYARDSGTANSALVVSVKPDDFGSKDALAGVEFQRKWESLAFKVGGANYNAPAQTVEDFLVGRPSSDIDDKLASYKPSVTPADLHDCLPHYVTEMIGLAVNDFNKKLGNFKCPQAVLTGVETRTSAPVRIVRDETLNSINITGLYPAGEGAGYAGGIVSAAVDGLRVAEAVIKTFAKGEVRNG